MDKTVDAGLELLDRQVVDADGYLLGKVEDLRFVVPPDGPPILAALRLGQRALGRRLDGRLGRWWESVATRLAGTEEPLEISVDNVRALGPSVEVTLHAADLPGATAAERWWRDALVARIPGANRAAG